MRISAAYYLTLITLISFVNTSFAKSPQALKKEDDRRYAEQHAECEEIKAYGLDDNYQAQCLTHYQHFMGDGSYRPSRSGEVRIASFNVFHPGSDSSLFKDMELVARLMDRFDVVAAQELLPLVGRHQRHNDRLTKYIDEQELKLKTLESLRGGDEDDSIRLVREKIAEAYRWYRLPGYLLILKQLQKLDSSWSLLLAPGADAAKSTSVKELVGFYYRASEVRLENNEHCERFAKVRGEDPVACFPEFSEKWLGEHARPVFSRRPFLASFKSGSFDFTLVTSHVVFDGPDSRSEVRDILRPAFGVDHYDELGTGLNKSTYARFAEVKMTLDIVQKIRRESREKDIIFLGDFNLETTNDFWSEVLPSFPGSKIYIDEKTTLSARRTLSSGKRTNGLSSSFDHVIMDPIETNECSEEMRAEDFVNGEFSSYIDHRYLIRSKASFKARSGGATLRRNMERAYLAHLESLMTIKRNKFVQALDEDDIEEFFSWFTRRIFDEQLQESTYFKMYREVISDHLPVHFSCSK